MERTLDFQLKAHKITGWVRQHKFHPTRRWRLDYYFPAARLGIEIDGGIYAGGRHSRGQGMERDNEKLNAAALEGIVVMRFGPNQVKNGVAVNVISTYLDYYGNEASE